MESLPPDRDLRIDDAKPARRTSGGICSHYRCVGVGVGPANLSLASLLHGRPEVSNLFLEKKNVFGWHDGQQIPGASLQVSLFKDLVTLADPTNKFSFLSYLHDQGKIYQFINAQFEAVPRHEFRNYMKWASLRNENILFGEEVLSVEFDEKFVLQTNKRAVTADHISIGIGSQPWVPVSGRGNLGDTQFHVSDFVTKARGLGGLRVSVVGGGQSGAEAFLDLISRPDSERPCHVSWISRRRNYFPIDDSPFTNDYFMPCYSDYFFGLERELRETFNADHVLLSDGISMDTLREIYQRVYMHRFVHGNQELVTLYPNRTVTQVLQSSAGKYWDIATKLNDRPNLTERVKSDVIVWATGFRPARMDFLDPIVERLERESGEFKLDQEFAVCWDGPSDHNIFVQNAARQQRGVADPNLSLIAWRSQRIIDRIVGVKTDDQFTSFIKWSANSIADEFL